MNDLYGHPDHLQSTSLTDSLEKHWNMEIQRNPSNPSLIRATIVTMGWTPFLWGFIKVFNVSRPMPLHTDQS
jgi:hypothetical protein